MVIILLTVTYLIIGVIAGMIYHANVKYPFISLSMWLVFWPLFTAMFIFHWAFVVPLHWSIRKINQIPSLIKKK